MRVNLGEDAGKEHLEGGLLQPLVEGHEAQVLRQVLEQDLDENAAAGSGVLLCQPDARQHRPAERVCRQQMLHQHHTLYSVISINQPTDQFAFPDPSVVVEITNEHELHAQGMRRSWRNVSNLK